MSTILEQHEKKRKRIIHNGVFYASVSSASFGFSPLFTIGLLAAGLNELDILSYRWLIAGIVLIG